MEVTGMTDIITASAVRLAVMFGIIYTCLAWVAMAVLLTRSWKQRNSKQIIYTPIECPMCEGQGMYAEDVCSLCDGEQTLLSQISGPTDGA
jgi:hypothetical protein